MDVGVDATLFDIDFDSADPNHGYVVGAKGTFLETTNAGKTWFPRSFTNLDAEEEINYRFEKVSFKDNEAWIIGKPAILLHSKDGGKNWERVPLSPKLPGKLVALLALFPLCLCDGRHRACAVANRRAQWRHRAWQLES